ncbi:MAG: hypothetical protein EP343_25865 [Deltaproteobacteria bacterium]|nr:MAG: hypothetical protein EP343_25865 [Deltaproteobacteria bacterium]
MVQGIGNGPDATGWPTPSFQVPMSSPSMPPVLSPHANPSFGLGASTGPNIQADAQFAAQSGGFGSVAQNAQTASMNGAGANPEALMQTANQILQSLSHLMQQMLQLMGSQQGNPGAGMQTPAAQTPPAPGGAQGTTAKAPGKRARKKRKAMRKAKQGGGKARGNALGNLAAQNAQRPNKGIATPPGQANPTRRPGQANNASLGQASNASDGPGGFLFKPQSENGGKLVVLTSEKESNNVQGVTLKDGNGNVLEQGRSSGFANGGREHFRFNKAGGAYPNNLVVEIAYKDGRKESRRIPNPGKRYD